MVLPNDLISKFVKITRDDKKTKNETTVYGIIKVESDGTKYVHLDGAEENQLTPAIMTVDAKDGDRVSVLIKDHTATVTGNITSPAARIETVDIVTKNVEAQNAKISNIEADNVEINNTLTAHKASMHEIEADNVTIKETLTAQKASIDDLNTNKLSTKDAEIKYANIDFANIGIAAIEKLFSDSGIIGDLVISDGHVTGKLVGVTIVGDLIEGGTVKAEKLVIRGTDGLFYKLNTNGATVSSEQTEYNSLSGTLLTAKSITAEKINVDDLVAFGATIGGFHITEDSIYSGAKASVDNTTRGIYQDTDGQFAIGDASNFLKFYKDTDGSYKLAISASTIMFGDSGKSVEEAIDEIKVGGRNLASIDKVEKLNYSRESYVYSCVYPGGNKFYNYGLRMPGSICTIGEKYVLSFKYQKTSGSITSIGGHSPGFTTSKILVDGTLVSVNNALAWEKTVPITDDDKTHTIELFCVRKETDSETDYLYIQPNRDLNNESSAFSIDIWDIKLEIGTMATDWTPAPEDIEKEIDNASKTAKNFLEYDTTNGLQIGNKTGGSWSGFRAQITAGAYNILNAAGVVLASYGEKLIELGKNATDAVIKLCGGKGQIEYITDEDSGTDYIQMSSDRVRVKSSKMSSVYSMYTDNTTRWEKSAVNVSPNKVELYASECIDPALPEHVDGWHVTRVDIKSGRIDVETPGPVMFDCDGVYDTNGRLISVDRGSSGIWKYSKWSDGTVDLWGVYSVSNLACTTALGGWYRTAVFTPNAFPFTVTNPRLVANYESDGYGAMLWATTTTTTTKPPSYYLIRPTSATIASGKIIFHVTGTWS